MEAKSVGAEDSAHHSEEDEDDAQQRYGNRTSERGGTEDTYELRIQVAWCMNWCIFSFTLEAEFPAARSGNSDIPSSRPNRQHRERAPA